MEARPISRIAPLAAAALAAALATLAIAGGCDTYLGRGREKGLRIAADASSLGLPPARIAASRTIYPESVDLGLRSYAYVLTNPASDLSPIARTSVSDSIIFDAVPTGDWTATVELFVDGHLLGRGSDSFSTYAGAAPALTVYLVNAGAGSVLIDIDWPYDPLTGYPVTATSEPICVFTASAPVQDGAVWRSRVQSAAPVGAGPLDLTLSLGPGGGLPIWSSIETYYVFDEVVTSRSISLTAEDLRPGSEPGGPASALGAEFKYDGQDQGVLLGWSGIQNIAAARLERSQDGGSAVIVADSGDASLSPSAYSYFDKGATTPGAVYAYTLAVKDKYGREAAFGPALITFPSSFPLTLLNADPSMGAILVPDTSGGDTIQVPAGHLQPIVARPAIAGVGARELLGDDGSGASFYQFDHWEAAGAVTLTDPASYATTVVVSGPGTVTAHWILKSAGSISLVFASPGLYDRAVAIPAALGSAVSVLCKSWGAGGQAALTSLYGTGGPGGYAESSGFTMSDPKRLSVLVGAGHADFAVPAHGGAAATDGGGGAGGGASLVAFYDPASVGSEYSLLAVAGGGAGATGGNGQRGGAGGGAAGGRGEDCGTLSSYGGSTQYRGTGGAEGAGGARTPAYCNSGADMPFNATTIAGYGGAGGDSAPGDGYGGGGGGGGFGGGEGGAGAWIGNGGGGGGYYNYSGSTQPGDTLSNAPGNPFDPDYIAGVGVGGGPGYGLEGGPGLVVITLTW